MSLRRVELNEVSRAFGRSFALHRASLRLGCGSATVLVGENGAGKTTLLNIVATIDRPTAGRVRYDDHSFDEFARRGRAHIGWVSHDSLLYEDLSGAENLAFYARMYGVSEPLAVAAQWLDRVGLAAVGDGRTRTYSRGMRQRLSVARALLHDPSLVLLDEPMTGLDQAGRELLVTLFSELRDAGKIVVMITHDLHLAREFVDSVVVLKRGKVTFQGEADVLEAFAEFG